MIREKRTLRQEMRDLRRGLPASRFSHAYESLLKDPRFASLVHGEKPLFLTASLPEEFPLWPILRLRLQKNLPVALPRVQGRSMEFYPISSLEDLSPGVMGILEPQKGVPETEGILLVPGLAFSPSGDRLGYGGGYYDRYLSSHPDLLAFGLGFSEQLLPTVPHDEGDVPLDGIFLDDGRVLISSERGKIFLSSFQTSSFPVQ